jgi:hypothetical protein
MEKKRLSLEVFQGYEVEVLSCERELTGSSRENRIDQRMPLKPNHWLHFSLPK